MYLGTVVRSSLPFLLHEADLQTFRRQGSFRIEPLEPRCLLAGDAPDIALQGTAYFAVDRQFDFHIEFTDPDGVDLVTVRSQGDSLIGASSTGDTLPVTFVGLIEPASDGTPWTATYRTTLSSNPDPNGTAVVFSLLGTLADTYGNTTDPGEFASVVVYPLDTSDTSHPNVQGVVRQRFTVANETRIEPLANVLVYVDANNDGLRTAGELNVRTDVDGTFTFKADIGGTVRVDAPGGWTAIAGATDGQTIDHALLQPEITLRMVNPTIITVLIASTEASAMWDFGANADTFNEHAIDLIASANRVLGNSDTNTLLDLAGTHVTSSVESTNLSRDLTLLLRTTDRVFDDVHVARDRTAADVVVLVTDYSATAMDNDTVGIAYQLLRPNGHAASAFAVVTDIFADDTSGTYEYLFAHEVGHVLGAGHDYATTRSGMTRYAHGYVSPYEPAARDIMAYGGAVELPFFSSPNVFHEGEPLGNATTADNARVIRETAAVIAAYRTASTQANLVANSVAAPRLPTTFFGGERVAVIANIANTGNRKYNGPVTIDYFLSTDGTIDNATLLKSLTKTVNLAAGRSVNVRTAVILPGDLVEENYTIVARITPMPDYVDGSTLDDVAVGPAATYDIPFIDPSVIAFAPPAELKLAGSRVKFTLANLGNVTARFRGAFELIFSADNVIDGSDLVSPPVAASVGLRSQSSKVYAATTRFARDLPAGTYTLFVRFISPDGVIDMNGDNNLASAVVTLV